MFNPSCSKNFARSSASQQTGAAICMFPVSGVVQTDRPFTSFGTTFAAFFSLFETLYCRLLLLFFVRKAFATTFGVVIIRLTLYRGRAAENIAQYDFVAVWRKNSTFSYIVINLAAKIFTKSSLAALKKM